MEQAVVSARTEQDGNSLRSKVARLGSLRIATLADSLRIVLRTELHGGRREGLFDSLELCLSKRSTLNL